MYDFTTINRHHTKENQTDTAAEKKNNLLMS